jgi:arsenate reductase-like glutaredoxin family protein
MAESIMQEANLGEKPAKRPRFSEWIAEMDRLQRVIKEDQAEIRRLSVEIQANFSETDAILDRLSAT